MRLELGITYLGQEILDLVKGDANVIVVMENGSPAIHPDKYYYCERAFHNLPVHQQWEYPVFDAKKQEKVVDTNVEYRYGRVKSLYFLTERK